MPGAIVSSPFGASQPNACFKRASSCHPHSGWHEEAPSKGALGWLAPKGLETVAPGKRSAARSLACEQFQSPGRATELSVALPGLTPLIARTPGCASLARGYSLSALPGRESVSIGQTHVYKVSNFLTNAGIAEHFCVSPPEAVVYHYGIRRGRVPSAEVQMQGGATQAMSAYIVEEWPTPRMPPRLVFMPVCAASLRNLARSVGKADG